MNDMSRLWVPDVESIGVLDMSCVRVGEVRMTWDRKNEPPQMRGIE